MQGSNQKPFRPDGLIVLLVCVLSCLAAAGGEPPSPSPPSPLMGANSGSAALILPLASPPPLLVDESLRPKKERQSRVRRTGLRDRWVQRMHAIRDPRGEAEQGPEQPGQGGDQTATSAASGAGEDTKRGEANTALPKAERGGTGATPTSRGQAQQEEVPSMTPAAPTPLILNRLLGLEDSPVRTFGWIENSFTGNANGTPRGLSNFDVFPNRLANQWQGNQYYVVVENPLEADDMVNFGFRVDTLFGNDWQFTKDYGLFDRAFINGSFAGLDLPQIYGEVHLPILTPGGLDIKGGRFYSPAGYSAVAAIGRPFITVPNSMNFTPFTFFGAMATLHLTDRINIYSGTINGFDRWIDSNYKWGYFGFGTWKSKDEKTNVTFVGASVPDQLPRFPPVNSPIIPDATTPPTPALAGRVNPFYSSSYREYFSFLLTQQWTEKFTEVVETDHIYDPRIIGFSLNGKPSSIDYHGLVHWFLYTFNDKISGGWRGEIFWDPYGAATGSRGTYYDTSLVLTHKPKPWLWLRGEARYDWSQFSHPYSDGTRSSQLTLLVATYFLF